MAESARSQTLEHVRGLAISAAVGIGIVYLVTVGETGGFRPATAAYGALIGIFGYVCCVSLAGLLRGRLASTRVPGWLAHGAVYFVGGIAGWLLANRTASALGLVQFRIGFPVLRAYFPVAGTLGLLVGLLFYSFDLLQTRLAKSVERLKEAEFAEKEIELARSIQQRILPPQELSGDGYRIAARNLPARFVAGDFYDVFLLPDGAVGLVVADVAGKGMGASLIMATVKAALPFLAADRSVDEALREANRRLKPRLHPREFVALTYARYDPGTGAFELANAGMPDPYVLDGNGDPRAISAPGPRFPLGVRSEVAYEKVGGMLAAGRAAHAAFRRASRGADGEG